MGQIKLYQCPVCWLHYKAEKTARLCESWCRANGSCNPEISKLAIDPGSKRTRSSLS